MKRKNNAYRAVMISFFILLLCFWAAPAWSAYTTTIEIRVQNKKNDCEQRTPGGTKDSGCNSHSLEFGYDNDNSSYPQIVGMRFKNLPIPQGATIDEAHLEFTAYHSDSGTTNLVIAGEATDDASNFNSGDIDARPQTSSVNWNNVPAWSSGSTYQSPEIKTAVQEIVNRAGWALGNDMAFFVTGTGYRVAKSWDDSSSEAPLLRITFTSSAIITRVSDDDDDAEEKSNGNMDLNSYDLDIGEKTVGVRFRDIQIPRGAVITKAYIQFQVDDSANTSGSHSFTISGQKTGDAPAFTNTDNDITTRNKTNATVTWDTWPNWSNNGEAHLTPDITALVQELVGQSGWSDGNAMVFMIEGTGKRTAESHDDRPNRAPMLHIEYASTPVPLISPDTNSIGATCYEGYNPGPKSFTITNTGSADMNYTITETDPNNILAFTPASGGPVAPGDSVTINLTFSTAFLATGTYSATLSIADANAANSPQEVSVSAMVDPIPTGSTCGEVPIYAENIVNPAIMILLDRSGSMSYNMDVAPPTKPQTPDLKTVVQEIVNITEWESGNDMAFIITGNGHRPAVTYHKNTSQAPFLHVEYTDAVGDTQTVEVRVNQDSDDAEEGSSGSMSLTGNQLNMMNGQAAIGIRFRNVLIPNASTITAAYIEFNIAAAQSTATSLTIYGESNKDADTFTSSNDNITDRTQTTASVAWNNIEAWEGVVQKSRMEIAKDVIKELVKDEGIAWGYGTWTGSYYSYPNYTKIHVGCKENSSTHQTNLNDAIDATSTGGGTPFKDSLIAGKKYFESNKKDMEYNEFYSGQSCQPMFLINITDGEGNTNGSTDATVTTATESLTDAGVTPIAVGFGIPSDQASQVNSMAKVANIKGNASTTDDLYALHNTNASGEGVAFIAQNKEQLIATLKGITDSIKGVIFNGSAPAPTTSLDLGNMLIVAEFDPSKWTGDVKAYSKNDTTGQWDTQEWSANTLLETNGSRKFFTVNAAGTDYADYTDATLANDNFACWTTKPIGDVINSTPVVVSKPAFFYNFDSYPAWKASIERSPMVYVASNDGALHAFYLDSGTDYRYPVQTHVAGDERWLFLPSDARDKLDTGITYDRCDIDYCHQFMLDGSPIVQDIYDTAASKWKTILVCGQREGGDTYFALDITSGRALDHINSTTFQDDLPTTYMWEFSDTDLGETWSDPSITRLAAPVGKEWGMIFGSGYATTSIAQTNKEAYLFGILARNKANLWLDANSAGINKIKMSPFYLTYTAGTQDFVVGETITGSTSSAIATVAGMPAGQLEISNVTGTFAASENIVGSSGGNGTITGTVGRILKNNSLSSPLTAAMDTNYHYLTNRVYAGDLYGIMYRVKNIGYQETPAVSKLFDFDPILATNNEHPIRGKASYGYGEGGVNWIYFGTGRYENQVDRYNMYQQYFFGLQETLGASTINTSYTYDTTLETLKDSSGLSLPTLEAKYITYDHDADASTDDITVRYIDGSNPYNQSWALRLDNTTSGMVGSERVITEATVSGGIVFFLTFIPDQDVCAGNGKTWLFALDYQTGLPPSSGDPVFDVNNDGVFDDQDRASEIDGDGNTIYHPVAGISVGAGQGAHPVLFKDTLFITTTDGSITPIKVNVAANRVKLRSWKEN